MQVCCKGPCRSEIVINVFENGNDKLNEIYNCA